MHRRFVFVTLGLLIVLGGRARAHPADEFPAVTLQIAIDEQAVELTVGIPARTAKVDVFDGMSPVEMDKMEPSDLADTVAPVFAERCPVTIDGVEVRPTILGAVVDMSNSRLPARSFPEPQVLEQGTLKFVAVYETKGQPRRVSIDWSIFSNQYDEAGEPIHPDEVLMVAALLSAGDREQFVFLSPMEPRYTWHAEGAALPADLLKTRPIERNWLHLPALSIGVWLIGSIVAVVLLRQSLGKSAVAFASCVAIGLLVLPYGQIKLEHTPSYDLPSDEEALAIFETLHRNIYRAFDYTDEGAVYDALAQSVDGPMLETIYNDVYQSLIMQEENGAVSKVVRVEMQSMALIDHFDSPASTPPDETTGSFVVRANWEVDGLVTHFSHTHARTNAFEAVYTVAPRGPGWRIVDAEILQQRRVDDGNQTAKDLFEQP